MSDAWIEDHPDDPAGGFAAEEHQPECAESPDGQHHFTLDLEYDPFVETLTCEYCGDPKP